MHLHKNKKLRENKSGICEGYIIDIWNNVIKLTESNWWDYKYQLYMIYCYASFCNILVSTLMHI
jgi:hypothetical protein